MLSTYSNDYFFSNCTDPMSRRRISLCLIDTEITPCQSDQWCFLVSQQRTWSPKWDLEHVILSAFPSRWKTETENKMHVDSRFDRKKWWHPQLILNIITKWSPTVVQNELAEVSSAALFIFKKKKRCCSDRLKLSERCKWTEHFHLPVSWHLVMCLMHVSSRFSHLLWHYWSGALYLGTPHL